MSGGSLQPGLKFLKCEELRSMTRKGVVNCWVLHAANMNLKTTKIYSKVNTAFS